MTLKKNIPLVFFIIFLGVFGLVSYSLSDSVDFQDAGFTYLFRLYFDNGKLIGDRDFNPPFELIAQEYQLPTSVVSSYQGEIISVRDVKLASFPVAINPTNFKGKVSAYAPYFPNAKTANFYNSDGTLISSIDLAPGGSVCNEDGVCGADTGENNQN